MSKPIWIYKFEHFKTKIQNMKKTLLIISVLFFSFQSKAQVEIATNPFALLFEVGSFSLDYNINHDFGVGLDFAFGDGNSFFYFNGKHYFRPRKGSDRFLLGSFVGTAEDNRGDNGTGLGFFAGYKWVSRKNITFELAGGLGRDFTGNIGSLPYAKLNFGYRFNKKIPKR